MKKLTSIILAAILAAGTLVFTSCSGNPETPDTAETDANVETPVQETEETPEAEDKADEKAEDKSPRLFVSRETVGRFSALFLFYIKYSVFLSRQNFRILSVDVAERAVAYSLVFLCNAEGTKQLFSPLGFKLLLCPVYPTASQSQFVRGKHKVAHD